ncbi:MAG: hypothetical protein SOZ27_06285 [Spirochaetia bacterium]|nr:hypothetical protein [Spirochaetia bacterium]
MKKTGLVFLLAVLLGCPAVSPLDENTKLNQSDSVYEALTGNRPTPPTNITVTKTLTKEGDVPTVSWIPTAKAVSYNVYRKKGADGEFALLKTVYGDSLYDDSVNGMHYSGTYYYTVTSVDMYDRESFRPNPVSVALSSPLYTAYANLLSVSQGSFAEVKEGSTVIVPANKLGILLKIEADPKIPSYQIQYRPSSSSGSWDLVAEAFTPDTAAISDPVSGKNVYYFMHVPSRQGVMYTYRITPIGEGGIVGQSHPSGGDMKDGFVYPSAVIDRNKIESYAGVCRIPVSVTGETGGAAVSFDLKTAEEEAGPYTVVNDGVSVNDNQNGSYTLDLSGAIEKLVGGDAGMSKEIYIQAVAKFTKSGGSAVETVPSGTVGVVLIKQGADSMELPKDIQVTHGKWNNEGISSPVTISWAGTSDPAVTVYRVYRTNRLVFRDGTDSTSWGSVVGTVAKNEDGSRHTFTDNTADAAGGYFYKINPSDSNIETQNNTSENSFVRAAFIPEEVPVLTVNTQTSETHIPVSWTTVPGAGRYRLQFKTPTGTSFSDAKSLTGASFDYSTATPGNFTFRVIPQIEFSNSGNVVATVDCPASGDAEGAVKLSDVKWIKLVMQTMMEGQGTIADRSTSFDKGGAATRSNTDSTVSWGARGYNSYGENDKYQVYKFAGYKDSNNAVTVDGILFHLYFTRSADLINTGFKKGVGLYLSFSSSADEWLATGYNNPEADAKDKLPGNITVSGVYPGELQIWAKNNVSGVSDWNQALTYINAASGQPGPVVVGDCTDLRSYEYIGWVGDEYGFGTVVSENPGINTSTAYSVKRSGASAFTNYSYSQVGALQ